MADKKLKLSKKQKEVMKDLRNGYELATNSDTRGAEVCHKSGNQYHINNRVFWNLVDMGLIFQNIEERFQYTLTELGKTIEL